MNFIIFITKRKHVTEDVWQNSEYDKDFWKITMNTKFLPNEYKIEMSNKNKREIAS